MAWNEQYIRQQVRNQVEGGNLWVLPYYTQRSGNADDVSRFIWDFKDGDIAATRLAAELLFQAIQQYESQIKAHCRIIACVPSSKQGSPPPNVEQVCSALAGQFEWLQHVPGLLQRSTTVRQAHRCAPGERPDVTTHLNSISVGNNYNLNGQNVLLFDDLLTRGDTATACEQVLQTKANAGGTIGLFLGRTQR